MSDIKRTVDQLEPGAILAKPIIDNQGRIIIQSGRRLTPMHLRRLQKLGIRSVKIEETGTAFRRQKSSGDASEQDGTPLEKQQMKLETNIAAKFKDDSPLANELKRRAIQNLSLALQDGPIPGVHFT